MQVFTTIHRLLVPTKQQKKNWTIQFGGKHHQIDLEHRVLFLGPPVVDVSVQTLEEPKEKRAARDKLRRVMMSWVMLESVAAAGNHLNLPWIPLPENAYEQNKLVPLGDYKYHHVVDRDRATKMLGAADFWLIALDSYLRSCLSEFSGVSGLKKALKHLKQTIAAINDTLADDGTDGSKDEK